MIDNPIFTAFYLSLIGLISILLLAISVTLFKIILHLFDISAQKVYKNQQDILQNAHVKAASIIEDAHNSAQEIIHSSKDTAISSLKDTQDFVHHLNEQHERLLLHNTNMHMDALEKEFSSLKTHYEKSLQQKTIQLDSNLNAIEQDFSKRTESVLSIIDQRVAKEMDALHEEMVHKLEQAQDTFENKSAAAYESVVQELEAYKKERVTKLNASINDVLLDVSEKVLGHSLSIDEHQSFILKSLEEAKHLLNA